MWRRCPLGGGRRGCGGAVGFLLLVFRVLVRGSCEGYGAGLHGVVGSPAVPGFACGRVGAGLWLPVGVRWRGGRPSRSPTGSGLQRTSCWGKRGHGVVAVSQVGVRQGG